MAKHELDFDDLQDIVEPVRIKNTDYRLYEASAEAVAKYRNQIFKGTKFLDGKPSTVEGIAEAEIILVAACIKKVQGNQEVPVTITEVKAWKNRITKKLFEKIKQISDLNEQEEDTEDQVLKKIRELQAKLIELRGKGDEAKNVLSATESISE